MPLIYRKAERTICWVGASLPPPASRLIRQLNRFRERVARSSSLISDPDPYHSDYKVSSSAVALFQTDLTLCDREAWKHLDDFLGLVYFLRYVDVRRSDFRQNKSKDSSFSDICFHFPRLWTIQDWITSTRLVLRCESKEFSWDEFCSALDVCIFFSACEYPASSGLLSVVIANYLRRRYHQPVR